MSKFDFMFKFMPTYLNNFMFCCILCSCRFCNDWRLKMFYSKYFNLAKFIMIISSNKINWPTSGDLIKTTYLS